MEIVEPSDLLRLPYELQLQIAMDLDTQSVLNLCSSARMLNSTLCKDESFWKTKYTRDFGPEKLYSRMTWLDNYKLKIATIKHFEILEIWDGELEMDRSYLKGTAGGNTFLISDIEDELFREFERGKTVENILGRLENILDSRGTFEVGYNDLFLAYNSVEDRVRPYYHVGYALHFDESMAQIPLSEREAFNLVNAFYTYYLSKEDPLSLLR
uniref:F-box-like protein n=1 Tax=Pithovirus LCPAC304 TaxID=2506594 RepID=A0A481Z936_9VIRU|nr:MAG: F-box-like protein [Pithovirus LCPAC304]